MEKKRMQICLVDDDADDRYLFAVALSEMSDEVNHIAFKQGDDLMRYLRDTEHLPDVILLDMNMPKKTGIDCLVLIKTEPALKDIPVMIYSTTGSPAMTEKALGYGASDYLLKPSSITDIQKLIKRVLTTLAVC